MHLSSNQYASPFLDPLLSINLSSFRWFAIGRPEVGAVVSVASKGHHWIDILKECVVIDYEQYAFSHVT